MSIFNDVMLKGTMFATESATSQGVTFEPEVADITIENAQELDSSIDEMEYALTLAHECDMFMTRFNTAIIAEEYAYLKENGKEMVWEAEGKKNIFQAAINWLQDMLGKIASWVKSIVRKMQEKMADNTKFLKKYDFANAKDTVRLNGYDKAVLSIDNAKKEFVSSYQGIADITNYLWADRDWDADRLKEEVSEKLKIAMDAKDEMLKKHLEKKEQDYSTADAKSFLEKYKDAISLVRSSFDTAKKTINTDIKEMKAAMKSAEKGEEKAWHTSISLSKSLVSILTSTMKKDVSYFEKGRSLARAIVAKACSGSSKEKEAEEPAQESASIFDMIMNNNF